MPRGGQGDQLRRCVTAIYCTAVHGSAAACVHLRYFNLHASAVTKSDHLSLTFAPSPFPHTSTSAGPAVIAWLPSGPNIGFLAPHDETFTIQDWFDKEIPAVFVYEAPPTARAYIKGGRRQHSSAAVCKLLTPGAYDVAAPGYDMLGALLFSDKPGQAPFWCGIAMNVADAKELDPAGDVGPTPFQVTGGLWSALQYVLQHPNGGDCFPEDVPTPFVMGHAFPWAGQLIAREAPEALEVPALFDPGAPEAMTRIYSGWCWLALMVDELRVGLLIGCRVLMTARITIRLVMSSNRILSSDHRTFATSCNSFSIFRRRACRGPHRLHRGRHHRLGRHPHLNRRPPAGLRTLVHRGGGEDERGEVRALVRAQRVRGPQPDGAHLAGCARR